MKTSRTYRKKAKPAVSWIDANWNASEKIKALTTCRQAGVSKKGYASLNLADHVGDDSVMVDINRQRLSKALNLPSEVLWLDQRHTTTCVYADKPWGLRPVADAVWTDQLNLVLSVMTADCMPILMTNKQGTLVCAIHAGWRGFIDGIIQASVAELPANPADLVAWVGPSISREAFEIQDDVRDEFLAKDPAFAKWITPVEKRHEDQTLTYLADLPQMAQYVMQQLGIQNISLSGLCSYSDTQRFFSYRRNPETGRMASLIWIEG